MVTEHFAAHCSSQVVMYHGTTIDAADGILRQGFKVSSKGLLGSGVYLTPDKSKAALYGQKLLICSVNVGRNCCIDRPDHPDRLTWPEFCDTKWIPGHVMRHWSSLRGEVYCVRDSTRVAVVDIHDVRCCGCSISECRQCSRHHKQQPAQVKQHLKGYKETGETNTGHSEVCCTLTPSRADSDSGVSDSTVDWATAHVQAPTKGQAKAKATAKAKAKAKSKAAPIEAKARAQAQTSGQAKATAKAKAKAKSKAKV